MEEKKVIVPDEFVFKGKHKLFMASEKDHLLWYNFAKASKGYRFISLVDGEQHMKEAIYCRLKNNPILMLRIADGRDMSMYRRVDADGWTNGIYNETVTPDLRNGQYYIEEQKTLFSEDQMIGYDEDSFN